jgi:hypothetical protein
MYITWKWSMGESYYKSARPEKQVVTTGYDTQANAVRQSLDAVRQSLDDDPFLSQSSMFSRNQNQRRENLDEQLAERELVPQRGGNPFLQSSHVNNIMAQDLFLKPVNTTFDRVKADPGAT